MLWNKSYYSITLSVLLHLLILIALPFSVEIKKEYKEDELLLVVIDEKKIPRVKQKPKKENCNCENCNCKKHPINKQQKVVKKKKLQKTPPKKSIKYVHKRKQSKIRPRKKPQQKKVAIKEKPINETLAIPEPINPLEKDTQFSSLPELKESDATNRGGESTSTRGTQSVSENDTIASSGPIVAKFGSREGPKFLHREVPQYPRIALKRRKEGVVILRLTIDENGKLLNVKVEKDGGYGFAQSAINAVRKSTFLPAKINGNPIACKCILPVKFVLN